MKSLTMTALGAAALGVAGLGIASTPPAHAAEDVVVIDRPDLQKLDSRKQGRRMSDLMGKEVYSNNWTRLGEIEDFVFAEGGYLYAVVDTSDGPLDGIIDWPNDGEGNAVVPWDQLRTASKPQ